jgi:hypothetical protein
MKKVHPGNFFYKIGILELGSRKTERSSRKLKACKRKVRSIPSGKEGTDQPGNQQALILTSQNM